MGSNGSGGPRRGGGHPAGPEALARTKTVRIAIRQSELVDLRALSDAWRVPLSTTAWVFVHERLSEIRSRATEFGPNGLAIVAGLDLLGYSPAVMRAAREIVAGRERQSAA